jgi:predicted ester cyclase
MPRTHRSTASQREQRAAANAALVRRVVEDACQRGDLAVLDEVLGAPTDLDPRDRLAQGVAAGPWRPERGGWREMLAAFRAAVPDAGWTILEQVAAGETVVTRLEVRGHFSGALVRLAPPGRPATLTCVVIGRFEGTRLVELWLQADLLGLLQQLGVMPPLDLAQAVTLAQVQRAGAMLAEEPARHLIRGRDRGGQPENRRHADERR